MALSRRDWLSTCTYLAFSSELAAAWEHARAAVQSHAAPSFSVLDSATAADVEALAAQIIPSTDGPGAREAGVIYFIDRALATFDFDKRDRYRGGMEAVQAKRRELFPASNSVAELHPEQQIMLLGALETTEFFELLRTHTVLGFVGDPSYGGNRGGVGWQWIGFEDRMGFEPPFGYYDAAEKSRAR